MDSYFLGFHHIAIIVSDYERSKYFYTQILGAEVVQETYRKERQSYKLDLRFSDSSQIELFSFPTPPPRQSFPESCGLRHLAFRVNNLQSAVDFLNEHHIACEQIRVDELTGCRFTFCRDPDGLPLELYELD